MNTSNDNSPVLANLAVGDLVCYRYSADTHGVVVKIEYIGRGVVVHDEHFVITVAWLDAEPSREHIGTITLLDGTAIARPIVSYGNEPTAPVEATPVEPVEVSAPAPPRRAPTTRKAAPRRAQSNTAPTTTTPATAPAPTKRWSKVEIVAMVKERPGAVDRGILCLNKHQQLLPEKTRSFVAFWAGWVNSGKTLSGKHLVNARRTCLFNVKVIVDAANGVI